MIFTLTLSILFTLSFTFPLMITPLTLGLWILFMAFTAASFLSLISSSWFGLILFIIYIGGMLVMFSYFAAVAPNQKLNIFTLSLLFLMTSFLMFIFMSLSPHFMKTQQTLLIFNTQPSFTYLLTPFQSPLLIALASLLLLALILVVKITNRNEGPLRPFSP